MIQVLMLKNGNPEILGLLPYMLNERDPRAARDQFDEAYSHGGGWRPIAGFKVLDGMRIKYPGDPAMAPIAYIRLRDELVVFYDHAFVMIAQKGGKGFEVARMD